MQRSVANDRFGEAALRRRDPSLVSEMGRWRLKLCPSNSGLQKRIMCMLMTKHVGTGFPQQVFLKPGSAEHGFYSL